MNKSYPKAGASVKSDKPAARGAASTAAPVTAPALDRSASRTPATFTPYYWEAYNEIVEPRRFDHYLIRKWLPDLGAMGLAIVKVLRDRCYHNPATGVLRDSCEMSMDELAETIGCSRAFLFKQFSENRALQQFVRRIEQYQFVAGKPKRAPNRYQVCMDDPIHWDDLERYDLLRSQKETERSSPPITRVWKGKPEEKTETPAYGSTTETHRETDAKTADAYASTRKTHSETTASYESTGETADTTYLQSAPETADTSYLLSAAATAIDNLPFGESLPIGSLTPEGGIPPINPPGGKENAGEGDTPAEYNPLEALWNVALSHLAGRVNGPTLKAHLKPMRLVSVSDTGTETVSDTGTETEAVLAAPTAFSRNWIEGRHKAEVEAALGEALGQPVTVRITVGGK